MGCLSVILSRIGGALRTSFDRLGGLVSRFQRTGGMDASLTQIGGDARASFRRIGGDLQCGFSLVCGTSLGEGWLFSCDARLLTYDGSTMTVISR